MSKPYKSYDVYDPKRGKKGKCGEQFGFFLFKLLNIPITPFPNGIYEEDGVVKIGNSPIEIEVKDLETWTHDKTFPFSEIDYAVRRKIREDGFQIVFNKTNSRFLIYSHKVLLELKEKNKLKEETKINRETGKPYTVYKVPIKFAKEFVLDENFDKKKFLCIIGIDQTKKEPKMNTPVNTVNVPVNEHFSNVLKVVEEYNQRNNKNINVDDILIKLDNNRKHGSLPSADQILNRMYPKFSGFRQAINIKTISKKNRAEKIIGKEDIKNWCNSENVKKAKEKISNSISENNIDLNDEQITSIAEWSIITKHLSKYLRENYTGRKSKQRSKQSLSQYQKMGVVEKCVQIEIGGLKVKVNTTDKDMEKDVENTAKGLRKALGLK